MEKNIVGLQKQDAKAMQKSVRNTTDTAMNVMPGSLKEKTIEEGSSIEYISLHLMVGARGGRGR